MIRHLPKQRITWLMTGILLLLALFMLAAANHNDQIGRYRMTIINRTGFPDIFVIDTATGVVKYVGKDEGKPFEQIKGK